MPVGPCGKREYAHDQRAGAVVSRSTLQQDSSVTYHPNVHTRRAWALNKDKPQPNMRGGGMHACVTHVTAPTVPVERRLGTTRKARDGWYVVWHQRDVENIDTAGLCVGR